jgi:hypothetical protein
MIGLKKNKSTGTGRSEPRYEHIKLSHTPSPIAIPAGMAPFNSTSGSAAVTITISSFFKVCNNSSTRLQPLD